MAWTVVFSDNTWILTWDKVLTLGFRLSISIDASYHEKGFQKGSQADFRRALSLLLRLPGSRFRGPPTSICRAVDEIAIAPQMSENFSLASSRQMEIDIAS